jgi:hypothetical protein
MIIQFASLTLKKNRNDESNSVRLKTAREAR